MKYVFVLFLMVFMSGAAVAQSKDSEGVQNVIRQQFQAFQVEDVGKAFAFASPNIRSMFGTAENFGSMVRRGYPMVWDHDHVRFGDLRQINGIIWQKVIVTDASGALHILDYQMIVQDGAWKINGVQYLQAPEVGA